MLHKSVLCSYPVKYLQDNLHGIMTGDFVMLAASTGCGKSSLSRMFTNRAVFENCPVVLYSLEDEKETFLSDSVYREYCKTNGPVLDFRQWLVDNTKDPEKYRDCALAAARKAMKTHPETGLKLQVVHEMQNVGGWNVQTILKQMQKEYDQGYRFFILDHLDVLVPSERPDDMVRAISALWKFVSDKQIALLTFSQLSTGRNKESLCPCIDDLRGSKAKVHTPTIVISIARHNYGYYSSLVSPDASPTYCRVIKNRQGGKTSAAVVFFDRGRYIGDYITVDCNESGTLIDSMTAKDLIKEQKKQGK